MYFNWSTYPFRRPPELDGQRGPRPSVLVVGAGPTGLTLALCLARLGVASVVVEARDAVSRGSRAAGINRRSLQVFDRIGVADTVLRHALRRNGTHNSTHWGDRLLHRSAFDDPAHEPHPAVVMLQQCWVEQILVDRALASPLIDLRWSTRVESVTPGPEGVEVTLATPEGPYTLAGDHLVAADGAHSAVRRALGLRYDGVRHDEPFVIIDFSMPDALEAGRRVWFDPPYDPRATTLLHRLPFDVWRLDALVASADDPAREAEPERARQRVAAHLAMMGVAAPWEFIEASLYRISMLSLPAYSAGRICFAGDAAHLMPIWSGRGMNHGIEDACNLAWKFAAVLQGRAPASLLNSYNHERQAVVHATLRPLARTTRFMTASSRGLKAMRNAVLSRSADCARARELFDAHRIVEAPYPLVGTGGDSGFSGGPAVGTLVPDRWIDGSTSLHQLLGSGFTGLYFAPDSGMPDGVAQQFDALLDDWPGATLLVIGGASSAQTRQPARARPVHDEQQVLRQLFGAGPGSFYLVRPDDRVAARWPSFDADAARSAYAAAQAGVVAAPAQAEAETRSAKDRLEDALLALADQIDVLPEQQAPVLLAELHRLLAAASAAPHAVNIRPDPAP